MFQPASLPTFARPAPGGDEELRGFRLQCGAADTLATPVPCVTKATLVGGTAAGQGHYTALGVRGWAPGAVSDWA